MAAPYNFTSLFLFLLVFGNVSAANENMKNNSIQLDAFPVDSGNTFIVKEPENGGNRLFVFCYPGQERTWYRIWTNAKLTLKREEAADGLSAAVSLQVFHGSNETDVAEKSKASLYNLWPTLPWAADQYTFYPFNKSCIGVSSDGKYTAHFMIKNPYHVYVCMALVGLVLFFFARSWSGNVGLHYGVGVSLGVVGSILIVMIIMLKFVPQRLKTMTYVVGAVSTSLSLYLYQYISSYLQDILANNWKVLCAYVLLSAMLSFALVYRYGPISDRRSLNLVKWSLQVGGLGLVYQSSHVPHVSMAVILTALAAYHFPRSLVPALSQFRYRWFPPQRRLLSEEEYYLEGEVETKKALEELRTFCRSPDCNSWKTMGRLASPGRFAQFIEGDSHVSDTEFESHMSYQCNDDNDGEIGRQRNNIERPLGRRLDMSAAGDTSCFDEEDFELDDEGDFSFNTSSVSLRNGVRKH